jgi:beta-carotene hydroxylase
MPRNPRRTIPALAVPPLADLGLAHLATVPRRTRFLFLVRPVVAAALALALAATGHLPIALALVPLWYGWSLTLVHHMVHGSLGASPAGRQVGLWLGGTLVLHSGHALVRTHLQHHRTDPDAADPEGEIESVPGRRLPLATVAFRYRLWAWAWRAGRPRGWIAAEAATHVGATGWAVTHAGAPVARLVLAVWLADVAFALLAARGPQTNWGRPVPTPLVAVRCRWTRWLLFAHNWHLEHHLYPQLPLPALVRVAPVIDDLLAERGVLVTRLP